MASLSSANFSQAASNNFVVWFDGWKAAFATRKLTSSAKVCCTASSRPARLRNKRSTADSPAPSTSATIARQTRRLPTSG